MKTPLHIQLESARYGKVVAVVCAFEALFCLGWGALSGLKPPPMTRLHCDRKSGVCQLESSFILGEDSLGAFQLRDLKSARTFEGRSGLGLELLTERGAWSLGGQVQHSELREGFREAERRINDFLADPEAPSLTAQFQNSDPRGLLIGGLGGLFFGFLALGYLRQWQTMALVLDRENNLARMAIEPKFPGILGKRWEADLPLDRIGRARLSFPAGGRWMQLLELELLGAGGERRLWASLLRDRTNERAARAALDRVHEFLR